jgi:hypothetical protein
MASPNLSSSAQCRTRVLGEWLADTLGSMNGLSNLYRDTGRYSEAQRLYDEALVISRRVLGTALTGQSKFGEAEPLVVSAYQSLAARNANIPQSSRSVLDDTGRRIAEMYQATEHCEAPRF